MIVEKPEGYPDTPNLDKKLEVQDKSQVLTDFVDWLNDVRGYHLCEWWRDSDRLEYANYGGYNRLFADFFGIDYDEMEMESRAILRFVQEQANQEEDKDGR